MAWLEHISHAEYDCCVIDQQVRCTERKSTKPSIAAPCLFWSDHTPWQEANLWAYLRITEQAVDLQTVEANLQALLHYANFLESEGLAWYEFPMRKSERCLVRYRGELVSARNIGKLAPSTVTTRMNHVVAFYRWVLEHNLLSIESTPWLDRQVTIRAFDGVGFKRSIQRTTTDLAIPNRKRSFGRVEGGLLPISADARNSVLEFAKLNASEELFLMLSTGFFTGMRLGTITDLKAKSLDHAVPDPAAPGLYRIAVGPGASPPVHTKFGVTGQVWIPGKLLRLLQDYVNSPRHILRQAKALPENKQHIFLTRFGNTYGRRGSEKSSAINVEISSLRKTARRTKLKLIETFNFHQTRSTFGTELARVAMQAGDEISALEFVRHALLHKDEQTTLKYIRFVQKTPIKHALMDEFTKFFSGLQGEMQ